LTAPDIDPVAVQEAFAAANGDRKIVVACGLSAAEVYTFRRMLNVSGVKLLAFKGDEGAPEVIEALSRQLAFSIEPHSPPSSGPRPLIYTLNQIGPDNLRVRLTVQAAAAHIPDTQPQQEVVQKDIVIALPVTPAPLTEQEPPLPREETGMIKERAGETKQVSPVQTSPQNDLLSLYKLAKANDPALGRAEARLASSRADSDIVRSSLFPRINAGGGISQIDHTLVNYEPDTMHTNFTAYYYNVIASMPLLHIPTIHNLSAADAALKSEEHSVSFARQNLIVRFVDAYYGLLKAQLNLQIAQEEISRISQLMDQAQAFLKAGTGDIIAVYEAQARLDSVIADMTRSESMLRLAEQRLSSMVGRPTTNIVSHVPTHPAGPEPDDIDWWLATMEKNEPQIRQAQEGIAQTQRQLESVKAEHLPFIQASGGYTSSKGQAFLPDVETRQWYVGATVTLPIYAGGETNAKIRRATAIESERRFILDDIRERQREALKSAFFSLQYNVGLIKALEQKMASADIQLSAVRKGRSIGTRSATDVITAEQSYSVAIRDYRNALYDNVLNQIQLKYATGILKEDDMPSGQGK
jgi:outer membrane protein